MQAKSHIMDLFVASLQLRGLASPTMRPFVPNAWLLIGLASPTMRPFVPKHCRKQGNASLDRLLLITRCRLPLDHVLALHNLGHLELSVGGESEAHGGLSIDMDSYVRLYYT
jgi:hypothetical protein